MYSRVIVVAGSNQFFITDSIESMVRNPEDDNGRQGVWIRLNEVEVHQRIAEALREPPAGWAPSRAPSLYQLIAEADRQWQRRIAEAHWCQALVCEWVGAWHDIVHEHCQWQRHLAEAHWCQALSSQDAGAASDVLPPHASMSGRVHAEAHPRGAEGDQRWEECRSLDKGTLGP